MKQSPVVIFVSRPEEIPAAEAILEKTPAKRPTVIASTPQAAVKLLEKRIDFIDSDVFYPNLPQIKKWQKFTYPQLNLTKACELGIHIYLGEIGHSLLTAQDIIEKLRPKKIYVTGGFCESPYRRYQTESFTLEPLAVKLIAEKLGIDTVGLCRSLSLPPRILLILRQLTSSLLFDLRHIFSPHQSPPVADFIFLGNHYQLVNLLPALKSAKDKIKFIVTGKAQPEIINQVTAKKIPFVPFDKFRPFSSGFFDSLKFTLAWFMSKPLFEKAFSSPNPLAWKLIEPKLWWYSINEFAETASVVKTAAKLFSAKPGALVTMATSDHFSRAIALTAISKKIPVVELQHGLYLIDCEFPFRSNNYFLVWSQAQRKQLHNGENSPNRYPLAGYPWFDRYRFIKKLKHKNIKTLTILILANFPHDLDDDRLTVSRSPFRFMSQVFTAVSALNRPVKLIFRPHPSCLARWVIPLSRQFKVPLDYDDRSTPLVESISKTDLVIANFTTAVVDAMLVGRPIFLYTLHGCQRKQVENFDATKLGAWKIFDTAAELKTLINETVVNKKFVNQLLINQKIFLRKHVIADRKPANKQIVDFLKNLKK